MSTHARPKEAEVYGSRIRQFRLEAGLNQPQLAKQIGVSKNAITNWEAGRSRPDLATFKVLCQVLGITADALLGLPTPFSKKEKEFLLRYQKLSAHDQTLVCRLVDVMTEEQNKPSLEPVSAHFVQRPHSSLYACAGFGADLSGGGEGELCHLRHTPLTQRCDEIITITGDSMEPRYHSGDCVLVEYTKHLAYGEVGIFVVDGEGTIKVYQPDGLHPLNPDYPILRPDEATFHCVGRVLGTLTSELLPTPAEQHFLND